MKKILGLMVLFIVSLVGVNAQLQLDSIQFDPQIIAAGDEVDIVVQFHDDSVILSNDDSKINNKDYTFKVFLEPDDTLTSDYVIIQDAEGDDMVGTVIFSKDFFYKKFRVKVQNNALAGNYEFRLSGQWYYKGEPEEGVQYIRFKMPVKKQGIVLNIATYETIPSEVRPGDNFVKIESFIENSGSKDSKSVKVEVELPEGLESSYANNNRVWVGGVNQGENKEMNFFIDVDEYAESGVYEIKYKLTYSDLDDNSYSEEIILPFLVKERPYLEVESYEGTGLAGDSGKLFVKVKNTGTESAESVDVRILKENSQPFTLDVRSDYIGELKPGEVGTAVFDLNIKGDAQIKEHDFKLLIRAKGDSDEGDDTIYVFSRRAKFVVDGVAPNNLLMYGLIGGGIIFLIIVVKMFLPSQKKGRRK